VCRPGPDGVRLQADADAIRDTGTTGVLAEVAPPDGRMAVRSGVADLKTREPVPWNACYRIGSTTKTFVSVVALQLVGEGRLGLNDTVEQWPPGLVRGNGNDGSKITVRHLLRHNSGLYDYILDVPRNRSPPPRTSGENVSAAPKRPNIWSRRRCGTSRAGHPRATNGAGSTPTTNYILADMISTAGDVNRFFQALLGGRLLRPAQLAEMLKTVRTEPWEILWQESGYGLGPYKRRLPCGGWVWSRPGAV
jgi:D-alanyl-D-alanine carboxypeptidase